MDDFFDEFVRLEFGIGLEVEDENVLAAETFAARIHELAGTEKGFDADVIFVIFFVFAFLFGFFFFGIFLGFVFLDFFDGFLSFLVFFFLFVFAERFAVFFGQRGDFVAVEVEEAVFLRLRAS